MDTKGLDTKDLDAVLKRGSCEETIRFFSALNEADRKALAPRVLSWWTANFLADTSEIPPLFKSIGKIADISVGIASIFGSREAKAAAQEMNAYKKEQASLPPEAKMQAKSEVIRTALLSCCSLSEIKSNGTWALPSPNFMEEIIKLRRPSWLPKFVKYLCDEQLRQFWPAVRSWEKIGLIAPEQDSSYLSLTAVGIAEAQGGKIESTLRSDSELMTDHIWRILADRETLIEMTRLTHFPAAELWRNALLALSSTNEIDRLKLLEATITALTELGSVDKSSSSEDPKDAIDWVVSIHEGLSLETSENLKKIDRYLGLLSARHEDVPLWTLEKLELWWQAGLVPSEKLWASLGNVFACSRKDPAVAALKLAKTIATKEKNCNSQVLHLCALALDHGSQDVQKRALDLMEKYGATADPETLELLSHKCHSLIGLNKQRLSDWIAGQKNELKSSPESPAFSQIAGETAHTMHSSAEHKVYDKPSGAKVFPSETSTNQEKSFDIEALELRALSIRPELASAAEIDNAIAWFKNSNSHLNSLTLDTDFPRLDPDNVLKPIENIDDLTYLCLQVLEENVTGDDLELAIDGIARLNTVRPVDFQQRISALRTRALNFLTKADPDPSGKLPYLFAGARLWGDVAALIIAWTDCFVGPWRDWSGGVLGPGLSSFVSARLREVAVQVAANNPMQLLSIPTHRGGWIDPRVFASRVIQFQKSGKEPALTDATQALLRLAPDHRAEALEQLKDIPGELAYAYRYALGDEVIPQNLSSKAIWIAASRARIQRHDDQKLREQLGDLGPDTTSFATYNDDTEALRFDLAPSTDQAYTRKFRFFQAKQFIEYSPDSIAMPTVLFHAGAPGWSNKEICEQYIWLQHRQSYFSRQIQLMISNLESQSEYLGSGWEPLFDSDVALTNMACWLIALGLSAKQERPRRLALDALIQAIDDGRIVDQDLHEPFEYFIKAGIRLSHWADALREASRVSPLHLLIICRVLEYILGILTKPEVKLIELFTELSVEANEPVSDVQTRDYLSKLTGAKSVKLAKSVLSLQKDPERKSEKAAAAYALEKRLERAERWQRLLTKNVKAAP